MIAEISAREVGRVDLREALELTALIARQEPHRLSRVGARWLERFLTERDTTLSEALLAASALSARLGTCLACGVRSGSGR